ncbi:recombinase family protein [Bradyrhizobium diazoefficiens]|nr:recombinase family protein [Bradyrhizobium diazoefficiens]MBR0968509.1 recombinase family protein [Bradyrhizobium diazoefficiens]MBR0981833.1 recombinase family protein [Bradyrhizobium diazoefficiens]MBR1011284.1 recombinase family protein [Bradyrhizobium diazoefficiens]MBR1015751.1 recombinase family protein [Bradyrhizobium diazoefficiens]MBR1055124.1 recombinase family protein [Bradyrhizobium diazoefficiens]
MSTDHQKYSTENQSDVIRAYAERRNLTIVRTYADEGRSGLRVDNREALTRLIGDVRDGHADFDVILVYDVSRWGRFQDADESAYYEFICKEAGIQVRYCAEQFENDGSLASTIIKNMKRAMAGEYSRELSSKVFAGQCRLITLGFRQGGPPGYGLRRALIDEHRGPKGYLSRGEYKSIQTDRVILTPGPPQEIEVVRRIYRMFVVQLLSEGEIATVLNQEAIPGEGGRSWTRGIVHQVLTNEKYIGHNVYNRVSFKLKQKRIANPPSMWVRADNAFEAVVDADFFAAAKRIIDQRSRRFSDEEMLNRLTGLLSEKGHLSGLVIDEVDDMPSSSAYRNRFGSLLHAYKLVGYQPRRDFKYVEINRALRTMFPAVVADTISNIEHIGGHVDFDGLTDVLTVNGEFTVSIVIARCLRTPSGLLRWKIRFDTSLQPDLTVAIRMDESNDHILDYYLLPWVDMSESKIRLSEENGVHLDAYRFDTLDVLFRLCARTELGVAA